MVALFYGKLLKGYGDILRFNIPLTTPTKSPLTP
ncbi:hypothetical protein HPELS_05760 [Helicobacter pylori ELS37]|uniref:Uncharacterized protein n=1 Tax=Helicobacter pylori ELS37 TaxID=1055527 RepID=A0ABC7ZGD1_HELPX|nr:hypothetical protein HPELS_05760 [Helicobacter pylori ELS37]